MGIGSGFRLSVCLVALTFCAGKTEAQNRLTDYEDTLRSYVAYLTDSRLGGRVAGTEGETLAAGYIYDYLQSIGAMMISPRSGDDFGIADEYSGDTLRSRNIIGIIPGYDPELKGEYLLLGAHLDGVTAPAADNNASGCAVLMNVARMISENKFMFRRSVIVAFFGAAQRGMAGSWYFLNRSFSEYDKIVAMLDLNSVGRSGKGFDFKVFTGIRGTALYKSIISAGEQPFALAPEITDKEPSPSDYRNFYEKNIPSALFSTGVSKQNGTRNDTPDILDYFQMSRIAEYIYSLSVALADKSFEGEAAVNGAADISGVKDKTSPAQGRLFLQRDVDRRASFMRGDERTFLKDWVYEYIKYPDSALDNGISGTVTVGFTVDKSGNVTDVKVEKSVDENLDAEAVRVIKASPKWSPALLRGEKVAVRIVVAVEFKLTKEKGKIGIKR